ncbi:hypothetical protein [Deinococcus roseus]|uniref:DUF4149 domain-containing protein n=1 Tax=Deinococcus roseus TaxID=392414 RepID=A0ABQ2CWK1_9DEIO|nr:hypothetical protein [Deinococcus roseus]GGJ28001.1 hypothetical protein GCM10008938_12590 [Deinococcus roseus]
MKSAPLSSPFHNDPEYPLYLYGSALVHSARIPALLLWLGLNAVVLVRNFGEPALLAGLPILKGLCVLLLVLSALMVASGVRRPILHRRIDQQMKEDMLYTKKNLTLKEFGRSHLSQLLGKVGTFTALHLLIIQLCHGYQKFLG